MKFGTKYIFNHHHRLDHQNVFVSSVSARHVVEEEKDIKRAMEFLHECDLLKIEDILPFFPDFVTIDHFKVCNAE